MPQFVKGNIQQVSGELKNPNKLSQNHYLKKINTVSVFYVQNNGTFSRKK